MSGLLPSEGNISTGGGGTPRILWLEDEATEQFISSLATETARKILSCLQESPSTATEISEAVDSSVQNVRHHLGNLTEADLVVVAGTRYSEKGREMKVYAPANEPFVVCVGGGDNDREGFEDAIESFLE